MKMYEFSIISTWGHLYNINSWLYCAVHSMYFPSISIIHNTPLSDIEYCYYRYIIVCSSTSIHYENISEISNILHHRKHQKHIMQCCGGIKLERWNKSTINLVEKFSEVIYDFQRILSFATQLSTSFKYILSIQSVCSSLQFD